MLTFAERVPVEGFVDAATATTIVYTVTNGKVLVVTDVMITAFNQNTGGIGRLNLSDGSAVKIPLVIPPAGIAASLSAINLSGINMHFVTPYRFTTNVTIEEVAGAITFSFAFKGYEE